MKPKVYSIARLKDGLSSVLSDVARGGEVVVTDHNRPIARIVPLSGVPPLPRCDASRVLAEAPIVLRRGPKSSAAALVRRMRDA